MNSPYIHFVLNFTIIFLNWGQNKEGKSCREEGLKAINPKFTYKFTKVMPRGGPYCEVVIEFKEE